MNVCLKIAISYISPMTRFIKWQVVSVHKAVSNDYKKNPQGFLNMEFGYEYGMWGLLRHE